ncbi:type II secretion system protein GspL [Marinomonas balearica]|uniref:Type II secretion system protein L n=1 Tax=Marinomonas balearica TaxID=491947 RepID=A0A4R6MD26_9GAMM|nr:type II secretion system protein GspL [Marinomonas balearica]TDO98169.1 general secretion pathway protein L [Marinomonas balearica]
MKQLVLALKEEFDELKKWSVSFWSFSEQGNIEEEQKNCSFESFKDWMSEAQKDDLTPFELIILLPAWRGQFHQFELQKGQARHLDKIAPFLLESHIAQSVEDTHFVTTTLKQSYLNTSSQSNSDVLANDDEDASQVQDAATVQSFAIANIVSKSSMHEWLAMFETLNTTRTNFLLPQAWLCDQFGSSDFCVFNDEVYTWDHNQLIQIPNELAEGVVQGNELKSDPESDRDFIAYQLSNRKAWQGMDLCRGEFGKQSAIIQTLWGWKWVAVAASVLFATLIFSMNSETERLNDQIYAVNDKSKQAFLRLVPEEGRIVNLSRQLKAKLRQSHQTNSAKSAHSPYQVLNIIDQARQSVRGNHSIVSVNYRNESYRIQWRAKNRDVFDRLVSEFDKQGFDVQLDQVLKRGAEYIGAFQLQGNIK